MGLRPWCSLGTHPRVGHGGRPVVPRTSVRPRGPSTWGNDIPLPHGCFWSDASEGIVLSVHSTVIDRPPHLQHHQKNSMHVHPYADFDMGVRLATNVSRPFVCLLGWEFRFPPCRRYPGAGLKWAKIQMWPNAAIKRSQKIGYRQTDHENHNGEVHFVPRRPETMVWGDPGRGASCEALGPSRIHSKHNAGASRMQC